MTVIESHRTVTESNGQHTQTHTQTQRGHRTRAHRRSLRNVKEKGSMTKYYRYTQTLVRIRRINFHLHFILVTSNGRTTNLTSVCVFNGRKGFMTLSAVRTLNTHRYIKDFAQHTDQHSTRTHTDSNSVVRAHGEHGIVPRWPGPDKLAARRRISSCAASSRH